MEIIQQIGSYAGLAAFVGLAVLSALYFSQARDLRRLREGPQPEPETAAQPATAEQPAATPAAAAGAAPAAAATEVREEEQEREEAEAPPPAAPAPTAEHAAVPAGGTATQEKVPAASGGPPGAAGNGAPPTSRSLPARPLSSFPTAFETSKQPWYRRLAPRYLILLAACAVVLFTGGVAGITLLTRGDPSPEKTGREEAAKPERGPIDPSTVTVAVLNGTTVPGLAQQTAGIVEQAGFRPGNVANSTQASAESAVLFAGGNRPAAREVGRELEISQVEPIDPETQALAGDADVVVLVGADRSQ